MKQSFLISLLCFTVSTIAHAQPAIQWQKSLGGSFGDVARSIQPTNDGGYIVAGYSDSNNGDVSGNHGDADYWVLKLDAAGAIQWQKSFGGSGYDEATSVRSTSDGGYVVAGYTYSNDGDVSGNHGAYDYWVLKLDSAGVMQWQKTLGGSGTEVAYSVRTTGDGGYVVAGYSDSNDGNVSGLHGIIDYWLVKLDQSGVIQWQKTLGGAFPDLAYDLQRTNDGGYILAGESQSNNDDVSGNHGQTDCWVVKLDSTGAIQWQKSLGGTVNDRAFSIQQTTDNGFIVTGASASNNGDVSGNHGGFDGWVVKLDQSGAIQWQKTIGGSSYDDVYSIQLANDGGYIAAGTSYSNDGDALGNHGGSDYLIIKLDHSGVIQWKKVSGGSANDQPFSVEALNDGGCIIAGYAESNEGDVSGNHGFKDYWVVKLNPLTRLEEHPNIVEWQIFPNPATNFIEIQADDNDPVKLVAVTDMLGRKLQEQHTLNTRNIDVSLLPDGVYLIVIVTQSGKRAQKKMVKQ